MISTLQERLPFLRALRQRPFALLLSGQTISMLGDGVFRVVLAWSVLQLTGSALAMGTVFLASLLPGIAFDLFGGVAADRLPRRLILLWSDFGRGLVVLCIAVLALLHLLHFWHLLLLSVLFGVADSFFQPAFYAFIPQLIDTELLQPANASFQISDQLCRMLGPVLGVALLAAAHGEALAYGTDALTFFLSATFLLVLRPAPVPAPVQEPDGAGEEAAPGLRGFLRDVRQGLAYVAGSQWLWITILIAALSNVSFSAPYVAVLPRLVHDRYAGGPALYGAFLATDAVGFLIASFVLGLVRVRRRGMTAYGVLLLSGLSLFVLGLPLPPTYRVVIALGACLCAGFSIGFFSVVEMALMQELVPGAVQGRVNSLNRLGSFVLLPAGLLLVGGLADLVGPGWVFVVGGLFSLLLAAAGFCVRSIRDLA